MKVWLWFIPFCLVSEAARGPVGIRSGVNPSRNLKKIVKESNPGAPLLLRVARGESVDRVPVWMMRQAGRHMKAYRELAKKYPSFRERSENPALATEIR
jgi:hypothetical protein